MIEIYFEIVEQNSFEFLTAKVKFGELRKFITISYRTIVNFDDDGKPIYNLSIQRKPSISRINEIKNYIINDENFTFPTNIIIALPSEIIERIEKPANGNRNKLVINTKKIELNGENPLAASIIDGQHRFLGLDAADKELNEKNEGDKITSFELPVAFIIDPALEVQAMIFSIINRTPVKVTQDLVYDLFGLSTSDSPQKTALEVALALNGTKFIKPEIVNPFYKRLKLVSQRREESMVLTQSTFIKEVVKLISGNLRRAEEDRTFKRSDLSIAEMSPPIFRDFYAKNKDQYILFILHNYFVAVSNIFKDKENNSFWTVDYPTANIINRTVGFIALLKFLIYIFPQFKEKGIYKIELFEEELIKVKDVKIIEEKSDTNKEVKSAYEFTSKSINEFYNNLVAEYNKN